MQTAYRTGRGSVTVRGRVVIEKRGRDLERIVIEEIPYGVNMSSMIERMADLVRSKKLTSISDIRDESARGKVRVVIDLKKDAYPKKILNQLYKMTSLQNSFHYNMLALVDGIQPRVLSLLDILREHIKHRQLVVRRRTEFELKKARERAHILEGLVLALDNIDRVIEIIRGSKTVDKARVALMKEFKLTEVQAKAILAMQLRTLAGLERQKLVDELKELRQLIKKLEAILASETKILKIIKDEFLELKEKFADERRSQIVTKELSQFKDEDLIPNEQVLVTLTTINYIKRSLAKNYKKQLRGGKGRKGMSTRDRDLIQQLTFANTHDSLLFFTNLGRVFKLKCYEIPAARLDAKGINVANLLSLRSDESVSAMLKIGQLKSSQGFLFMCTEQGVVKKTAMAHYQNLRQNGLITINLDKGDQLKWVRLSSGEDEILISTAQGQANRFLETDVRSMGRKARGVRGIKLRPEDYVVGMDVVEPKTTIFVISQNGYGKQTKIEQFTQHRRGGIGIRAAIINKKTGNLVIGRNLNDQSQEVVVISAQGKVIRVELKQIPKLKRVTQGVRLMRLDDDDHVASVVVISQEAELEAANELKWSSLSHCFGWSLVACPAIEDYSISGSRWGHLAGLFNFWGHAEFARGFSIDNVGTHYFGSRPWFSLFWDYVNFLGVGGLRLYGCPPSDRWEYQDHQGD